MQARRKSTKLKVNQIIRALNEIHAKYQYENMFSKYSMNAMNN